MGSIGHENTDLVSSRTFSMEEVVPQRPDIICLPETFPFASLTDPKAPLAERAEEPIGEISRPFADFARTHHCYVVCPIVTKSRTAGQTHSFRIVSSFIVDKKVCRESVPVGIARAGGSQGHRFTQIRV